MVTGWDVVGRVWNSPTGTEPIRRSTTPIYIESNFRRAILRLDLISSRRWQQGGNNNGA